MKLACGQALVKADAAEEGGEDVMDWASGYYVRHASIVIEALFWTTLLLRYSDGIVTATLVSCKFPGYHGLH